MTQTLETVESSADAPQAWADAPAALPNAHEYEQFDYRPMPILAPVAGVFGVCSFIAYLGLFGIGLALVGVFASLLAVLSIKRSDGALSGMWVAVVGLLLSLTNVVGGCALQVYLYQNEVPEGFARVNFNQQISQRGFVTENGVQRIPSDVEALFDKPIFIKGFMYPTGQTDDLPAFLLLKDSGECCFGGQPALQDMIGVRMAPGKEVDFYQGRVAIAGKLSLNEKYQGGSLEPVYVFDAEFFTKAKTAF